MATGSKPKTKAELTPPPADALVLTLEEVAWTLRSSLTVVKRLVADGRIATVPRGTASRGVLRSDLEAYLAAGRRTERPAEAVAKVTRPAKPALRRAGWDDFDPIGPARPARKKKEATGR